MAVQQQITFDSVKGVQVITSRARTISEAIESAELTARTAPAIRLLHQAAKQPSGKIVGIQPHGTEEVYVCACGHQFYDRWDAIGHVERDHASVAIRQDLDRLESTVEALITPNPLTNWDALTTGTITQEEFDAVTAKTKAK